MSYAPFRDQDSSGAICRRRACFGGSGSEFPTAVLVISGQLLVVVQWTGSWQRSGSARALTSYGETMLNWEIRGVFCLMAAKRLSTWRAVLRQPTEKTSFEVSITRHRRLGKLAFPPAGVPEKTGPTFRRSETRQFSGFAPVRASSLDRASRRETQNGCGSAGGDPGKYLPM